jgi:hypothetical protein
MKARAGALLAAWFLSVTAVPSGGGSLSEPPTDADRIKALSDEERQWLTEFVAPILLAEEKSIRQLEPKYRDWLDLARPF